MDKLSITSLVKDANSYYRLTKIYKNRLPKSIIDAMKQEWIRKVAYGDYPEFIPSEARDRSLCLELVKINGKFLIYVPNGVRDQEICTIAFNSSPKSSFKAIPDRFKTEEVCLRAVNVDGMLLAWVPLKLRKRKICLDAVTNNGNSLPWVPSSLRDYDMCSIAINHGLTDENSRLAFIPDDVWRALVPITFDEE